MDEVRLAIVPIARRVARIFARLKGVGVMIRMVVLMVLGLLADVALTSSTVQAGGVRVGIGIGIPLGGPVYNPYPYYPYGYYPYGYYPYYGLGFGYYGGGVIIRGGGGFRGGGGGHGGGHR